MPPKKSSQPSAPKATAATATTEPPPPAPGKTRLTDHVRRGIKKSSPQGTATYIALLLFDVLFQYARLVGVLETPAFFKLEAFPRPRPFTCGNVIIDHLYLPLPHLVIFSFTLFAALKRIYWVLVTSEEELPILPAFMNSLYNMTLDTFNVTLFLSLNTSTLKSRARVRGFDTPLLPAPIVLGAGLGAIGILLEFVSETQRWLFKRRKGNEDKVMRTGLWRFARHINYTGYTLWRAGFAMACAGGLYGIGAGLWELSNFISTAIPLLDAYCAQRYGAQWQKYKQDTPTRLLPGL